MRQKLAVLENGMDALRKSSSISRKPTMNFLPTASRDKAQAQHKHSNQYDDTVSRSTTSTRSMMLHYDDAEVYSAEKGENGEHEAVANDARHETIQQEPTGHDDSGVVIAIDDDFEDELPSTGLTSGDGATMVSKRAKLSLSSALNANVEAANSSPSALHSSVRPAVSAQPHIEFSEMSTLHSAKDSHRSEFVITKSSSGRSAVSIKKNNQFFLKKNRGKSLNNPFVLAKLSIDIISFPPKLLNFVVLHGKVEGFKLALGEKCSPQAK
eukprot:m.140275 g.140275  ORF g.140275 m.140275 type:complete len:268 (-) comp15960_c0_seq2:748-1551(-)